MVLRDMYIIGFGDDWDTHISMKRGVKEWYCTQHIRVSTVIVNALVCLRPKLKLRNRSN